MPLFADFVPNQDKPLAMLQGMVDFFFDQGRGDIV